MRARSRVERLAGPLARDAPGPSAPAGGRRGGESSGRRRARGRTLVVEGVTEVAASLRAGLPPAQAWAVCGITVVDGVPREVDVAERLGAGPTESRAVVAASRCALELGAAQAQVLERVAASLVAEEEAEAGRRAALAGPSATARLLLWLPVLGLGLGVALGARPWDVLLDGGAGTTAGAVGLILGLVGRQWSRRLLRVARVAGTGT